MKKLSKTVEKIFDEYLDKCKSGLEIHRYEFEKKMQDHNEIYRNPQVAEKKLKDTSKVYTKYSPLFYKLYGHMEKYREGSFKL